MRVPGIRVLEYRLLAYRRTWRGTMFFTFLQPILFLAAMGWGLGAFVDRNAAVAFEGVSYLAFLRPVSLRRRRCRPPRSNRHGRSWPD